MLVGAIAISKNEIREREGRVGRKEGRNRRKEETEREERVRVRVRVSCRPGMDECEIWDWVEDVFGREPSWRD